MRLISCSHIARHALYNEAVVRKCTIRILALVPIFALDSWVALLVEGSDGGYADLLTCVRDIYEAVALLSFMQFALTIVGGPLELSKQLRNHRTEL